MDQADLSPALERASLSDLLDMQDGYTSAAANLKDKLAAVKTEIGRRFAASAKESLKQKGKDHGSVTLQLQDRLAVKGDIKQEVKWDSAKLMAVAQTLPWERVVAIFKIDFSVSETIYKGIAAAAPELKDRIDDARTTTIKEPALKLVREEGA